MKTVVLTELFKPKSRYLTNEIERISLLYHLKRRLPNGALVLELENPNVKKGLFQEPLIETATYERRFAYWLFNTNCWPDLLKKYERTGVESIFFKYIKDVPIITGNFYLDDEVQKLWESWKQQLIQDLDLYYEPE